MIIKEHSFTSSDILEKKKPPLSFAKLRHSSGHMPHARPSIHLVIDPEIPFGAYDSPGWTSLLTIRERRYKYTREPKKR